MFSMLTGSILGGVESEKIVSPEVPFIVFSSSCGVKSEVKISEVEGVEYIESRVNDITTIEARPEIGFKFPSDSDGVPSLITEWGFDVSPLECTLEIEKYIRDGEDWIKRDDIEKLPTFLQGSEVEYKVVVKNLSDEAVEDIYIYDSLFPEVSRGVEKLESEESVEFVYEGSIHREVATVDTGYNDCYPEGWREDEDVLVNQVIVGGYTEDGIFHTDCDSASLKVKKYFVLLHR